MYRSILVPLDGSLFGEHALPLALGLARRSGAALRLVHVYTPLAAAYAEGAYALDPTLDRDLKEHERASLSALARRLGETTSVPVHWDLLEGPIAPTVRAAATAAGADLIVMTTHGRGPLARFWLGSVADELVRESPVPVLLVRPGDGPPDLDHVSPLRHILLPLDGTPLAEQMVEPAAVLGAVTGAGLTLLRVVEPVVSLRYPVDDTPVGQRIQAMLAQVEKLEADVRADACAYLEGVAGRLRARGLAVKTQVAVDHHPASAILREAAPTAAGVIALATHGRRGLKRLFLGSVADKVIRGAAVPVLVQRPAE